MLRSRPQATRSVVIVRAVEVTVLGDAGREFTGSEDAHATIEALVLVTDVVAIGEQHFDDVACATQCLLGHGS